MSLGRSTISPTPTMTGMRSSEMAIVLVLCCDKSVSHQRIHVLDGLGKFFLEFLHDSAGRLNAVDEADALADEVTDEVARLRVARSRSAVDRVEGVAADHALQRH